MADGSFYEGDFDAGRLLGVACLWKTILSATSIQCGPWYPDAFFVSTLTGEMTGSGFRQYSNGDAYSGEFQAGERHGGGIMMYKNGAKYEGDWRANQYWGM